MKKNKINKNQKIIKIIDTPFSSFVLEKIFENYNNIEEIIEIKKDLGETRVLAKNILKISKKKLSAKNKFIQTFYVGLNLSTFKVLNFLKFYKLQKKIFKKISFKKEYIYIGSKTSTIMQVLPRSNRIFIDHGFSDYNHKAFNISFVKKIIDIIKEKISNFIIYPYISFNEDKNSYTICKIPKSTNKFIDMQYLPINQILKNILIFLKKENPRIDTIFLLSKNWQVNFYKDLNYKEVDYDHINFELIKKYANKGQKFFIKFHDFNIRNKKSISSFLKKINNYGYRAIDVDSYVKLSYRGMIPAEVFINRLKLKRVIAKYSSTLHNICHNKSLDCIMDINTELQELKNHPILYEQLLKEFNLRYRFNKSLGEKINIKLINEKNI
jgi:hypothetical protein